MSYIIYYLARIMAVVCVFSPHEFAHAYVAYKNGDGTAKLYGRMTLNPKKHIEPAGFILCLFVGFGWAKPVPVNSYNFRNRKVGMFTTAVAGVAANYVVAFLSYLLFVLSVFLLFPFLSYGIDVTDYVVTNFAFIGFSIYTATDFFIVLLCKIFNITFLYSVYSVVFNLLPLYPLDGFRVVESFTRQVNPVRSFLRNYGQWILIALLVWSYFCGIMDDYYPIFVYFDLFYYLGWFAQNILAFPITICWNWILAV